MKFLQRIKLIKKIQDNYIWILSIKEKEDFFGEILVSWKTKLAFFTKKEAEEFIKKNKLSAEDIKLKSINIFNVCPDLD